MSPRLKQRSWTELPEPKLLQTYLCQQKDWSVFMLPKLIMYLLCVDFLRGMKIKRYQCTQTSSFSFIRSDLFVGKAVLLSYCENSWFVKSCYFRWREHHFCNKADDNSWRWTLQVQRSENTWPTKSYSKQQNKNKIWGKDGALNFQSGLLDQLVNEVMLGVHTVS